MRCPLIAPVKIWYQTNNWGRLFRDCFTLCMSLLGSFERGCDRDVTVLCLFRSGWTRRASKKRRSSPTRSTSDPLRLRARRLLTVLVLTGLVMMLTGVFVTFVVKRTGNFRTRQCCTLPSVPDNRMNRINAFDGREIV